MKKFPKAEIKEINDTKQNAKKLTNFQKLIKGQKPFNQAFWGYLVLPLFLSLHFSLFIYLVMYDQIYPLFFEHVYKFFIILVFISLIFSYYFFLAGLGTLRASEIQENLTFLKDFLNATQAVVTFLIICISFLMIASSLIILFIFLILISI